MDHSAYIAATKNALTFADRCKSGKNAPAPYLASRSTRDCRLHANEAVGIRVKAPVAIVGGRGTEADGIPSEYNLPIPSAGKRTIPNRYRKVRRPNGKGMML